MWNPLLGNGTPNKSMCTQALNKRRKRLWELPESFHCPIIGVCLPMHILRTLIEKQLGKIGKVTQYDLHSYAVAQSATRNAISERLENALNTHFANKIRYCSSLKCNKDLLAYWHGAVGQGDVAGALWVMLTHPKGDVYFTEEVCRDMHMIQHQAGAETRIDIQRFHDVIEENVILTRELGQVQDRSSRLLKSKTEEIEDLHQANLVLRGKLISKDSELHLLQEQIALLRSNIPHLQTRENLQARLDELHYRIELQSKLLQQTFRERDQALEKIKITPLQIDETHPLTCATDNFRNKSILCVGGRIGEMAKYRSLVERSGAQFAFHDGGLENRPKQLDSSLEAADLVICQTGCISHQSYWRVKDYCKRTGKRCVFLENPSTSSLSRQLIKIGEETLVLDTENKKLI